MPQHKSAIKRVRQNHKRRAHNNTQRSKMRTLIKKLYNTSDKSEAEQAHKDAVSYIDKMSAKGILHPNNAARRKAQLTKYLNNL